MPGQSTGALAAFTEAVALVRDIRSDRGKAAADIEARLDALEAASSVVEAKQATAWDRTRREIDGVQNVVASGLSQLLSARLFSDAGSHEDHSHYCVSTIAVLTPGDTFRIRRGPIKAPLHVPAGVTVLCCEGVTIISDTIGTATACVTLDAGSALIGAKVLQRCRTSPAVRVQNGDAAHAARLWDCSVESDNMPAVVVESGAQLNCREVTLSSGGQASQIVVREEAAVTLEKCNFSYTAAAAAAATTGDDAISGVACIVGRGSHFSATNSNFTLWGRNGFVVEPECTFEWVGCTCTGGRQTIRVSDGAAAFSMANCSMGEMHCGMLLGAVGRAELRGNRFFQSQLSLVIFTSSFAQLLAPEWMQGNCFEKSEQYGILGLGCPTSAETTPTLTANNTFVDNKLGAIKLE